MVIVPPRCGVPNLSHHLAAVVGVVVVVTDVVLVDVFVVLVEVCVVLVEVCVVLVVDVDVVAVVHDAITRDITTKRIRVDQINFVFISPPLRNTSLYYSVPP
jgi:hypothetical protein